MRDYKQNEQLVRNLGSRYYQVVYPVQVSEIESERESSLLERID